VKEMESPSGNFWKRFQIALEAMKVR